MQTKWQSLWEAFINIAVGFVVALASTVIIFPLFGINQPFIAEVQITLYFTVISIIRSYALRRYFNKKHFKRDGIAGSIIEPGDEIIKLKITNPETKKALQRGRYDGYSIGYRVGEIHPSERN